ncbi:MAG: hypothetical protein HY757_07845 [Nitrospirae bacterium]|nr:hypothetical protein [Nitrospirota bacterium]
MPNLDNERAFLVGRYSNSWSKGLRCDVYLSLQPYCLMAHCSSRRSPVVISRPNPRLSMPWISAMRKTWGSYET